MLRPASAAARSLLPSCVHTHQQRPWPRASATSLLSTSTSSSIGSSSRGGAGNPAHPTRLSGAIRPSPRPSRPSFFSTSPAPAAAAPPSPPATSVPAALVKQLRDMTGAPMMDCKNALVASGGDLSKSVDWLRKKGVAAASKQASRTAAQGLVLAALDATAESGVLVELNSETDFVSRNEQFQGLLRRLGAAGLESPLLRPQPGQQQQEGAPPPPTGSLALPPAALSAWLASPLPGGDALGAPASVAAAVTELAARVRENVVLRRAARLSVPGGVVAAYTHNAVAPGAGSIGVLVGLRLPGGVPLVPGTPAHAALADCARRVAMHVAAARPSFLSIASVDPAALARERAVLSAQSAASGKTGAILERMTEGRLAKFYGEAVLSEQAFVLGEGGAKVGALVAEAARAAGVPLPPAAKGIPPPQLLVGFHHFVVGEGAAAAPAAGLEAVGEAAAAAGPA